MLTDEERFNEYRHRLCSLDRSTLKNFTDAGTAGKVDIPLAKGLLGISGSADYENSVFKEKISTFCDDFADKSDFRQRFMARRTEVSRALGDSVKACIDAYRDVMITMLDNKPLLTVQPQAGFETFTADLYVRSSTSRPIVITAISPEGKVTCQYGNRPITPGFEVPIQRNMTLTCVKSRFDQIDFGVDTQDQGITPKARVPAEPNKLLELTQQVEQLNERAVEAASRLAAVEAAKVPPGTIAYYRAQTCPPGWTPEEFLRGRYAVGVRADSLADVGQRVGMELANKENRATGSHTHQAGPGIWVTGDTGRKRQYGDYGGHFDTAQVTTGRPNPEAGTTVRPGTNAPYVQLLACRKS